MSKPNENDGQVVVSRVPKLRFEGFEGDWEEYTLIQVAKFRRGSFPQPYGLPEWYDDTHGTPFVQVYDVDDNFCLKPTTKNKISKLASEQSVFIAAGTLIVTIQGSIGRVAITQYDAYIDRTLLIFEKFLQPIEKRLFAYVIHKLFEIKKENAAGGTIKTITKEELSTFKITLPILSEQQKITSCLSSLDDLITAESQKLESLKEHKKGLMQKLFPQQGQTVPELRFEGFEGDWEEYTLIQVAKFRRGSFPQPYGLPEWYDDIHGIPFIQVYDVDDNFSLKPKTKNKISKLASKQSVFIAAGTLIVTIQGSIGRVAITQYDAYIDRTLLIFERFLQPIEKRFFAYVIHNLFEIKKEKAAGGTIKTITKEELSAFKITLPTLTEQQKIASCLSSLDDLITSQADYINTLKQHKKGLMQQLFPSNSEA